MSNNKPTVESVTQERDQAVQYAQQLEQELTAADQISGRQTRVIEGLRNQNAQLQQGLGAARERIAELEAQAKESEAKK